MKNSDFAALAERMLPMFPDFKIKAPLMFVAPVGQTLRGICFESHGYEKTSFYVWAFFLPLFVPVEHVSFEFGKRLGRQPWDSGTPTLIQDLGDALQEALPRVVPIKTPRDVVRAAVALNSQNVHVQQMSQGARETLQRLLVRLDMFVRENKAFHDRLDLAEVILGLAKDHSKVLHELTT